jgi:SPP1 family predicted phage head-tail adaptor
MPGRGDLTELVDIEQEARVSNGQGGYTTSWSKLADEWAEIIGMSGDEALLAGVQRAVQQWRVTISRRDDVKPRHRIKWGDLYLDIKAAMPLPKDPRNFTLLICESGAVT